MKRWFKSLGHRRCWVAPGIMAVLVLLCAPNMAFAATGDLYGDVTANASDENCPDLDGLNPVGFIDFSILGYNWRSIGRNLPGDLNTDSIVDIDDLAILAAYWLNDCFIVSAPDVVGMDPDRVSAGESTPVTITAYIDPKLDRTDSEVELLRLDAHGQVIDTLGYLHDDGLMGDATAGDNIFTIQRIFTEPEPTQVILQVSVFDIAHKIHAFSDIFAVVVVPAQPQLDMGQSLRLMTFNTQLLDTDYLSTLLDPTFIEAALHAFGEIPDIENEYGMENDDRAKSIANAILNLQPKPDVIALQEVFDDDAKDEFEDALKGTYPYYVYGLDAGDLDPLDSGLMLFSRFPFAPLPNDQYKYGLWSNVAFIEFDDHSGFDAWANKGVGFVRIQVATQPYSKYINVAFAHTQASYGADGQLDAKERVRNRKAQLNDIRKIIQGSLNSTQLENEPVFVMGDLNINGNRYSMENYWDSKPKTTWDNYKTTDDDGLCYNYEWDYHFSRYLSNSFFSTDLSDSWMYDTASTDPGQTTSGDFPLYLDDDPTQGERLDYILHNNNNVIASAQDMLAYGGIDPTGKPMYCIQHIRRVWEPALGNIQQYSDHLPLMADINLYGPYCNPLIAYATIPNPDAIIQGKITYKGSMQWYYVGDKGGSYSIMTSGDVRFDVYEAKDLSRPIRVTGEITEWGMQYSIPEAPFYIRVLAQSPYWTGDYTIKIHLHLGKSKDDAILLDPLTTYLPNSYGYGYLYQMPTISQINPENTVWFKILPEHGETGGLPSMKAMLDFLDMTPGFYNDEFTLDLMTDDDDVVTASKQVTPFPYSELPPYIPQYDMWREQLQEEELSKEKYYLRVHSVFPETQGYKFIIHWQTNLTYFVPKWLKCYEQDDDTGDDDVYCWITVDSTSVQNQTYLGEFDDGGEDPGEYGTKKAVVGIMGYRYVDDIDITLREHDGYPSATEWNNLGVETIGTLPMDQKEASTEKKWIKGDPDDDPDYDYRLTGKLYHQLKK